MSRKHIAWFLIIALLLTGFNGFAVTENVKAATKKGVVNTDGLNVRTGAGTNYEVLQVNGTGMKLNTGDKVTILEELTGDWYKVKFTLDSKKYEGYVASMYVTLTTGKNILAENISLNAKMVSTSKIYKKASSKSSYLKYNGKTVKYKKGKSVSITGVRKVSGSFWYAISFSYKGETLNGYVNSAYVKLKGSELTKAYILKKVKMRKGAGEKKAYTKVKKKVVNLKLNKSVKVIKEKIVKGKKWFYIRAIFNKKTVKGWVPADTVMFRSGTAEQQEVVQVTPSPTPSPVVPLSDAEFEAEMVAQGFPESYKPYLRQLHASYPYWQFKAYKTGLDWNTAVDNEAVLGKSLISNTKVSSWKSCADGAYDWVNDKYIVFDGKSWVNASREAVAYYMDPRNFLNEQNVFMFEALAYEPAYQTVESVASVLSGTIFNGASYTFTDDLGVVQQKTYQDTFVEAATLTGASPLHLATRMKQEVVTGETTVSVAVTGTEPGYEGIYNFYNIGASDSSDGQAVYKGLNYAATGNTFMRPWNNQYRAIVGGAQYIANNYISKGQNTIYLERFNVTPNNTYNHQYMTNVAAAQSESVKTYAAYKPWMADKTILFYIPVYENMPETPCTVQTGNYNPNNYLKSLSVKSATTGADYTLSPAFNIADGGKNVYTIAVPMTETSVTVAAETVNRNALVSGTGVITLTESVTNVTLNVTAQNGTTRSYTLVINKY